VISLVKEKRPNLGGGTADEAVSVQPSAVSSQRAASIPASAVGGPSPVIDRQSSDAITDRVLEIVAEKTGYPQDMLDVDLDLEADLGVDTVKQAETFQALREAFDISRQENLKLRDYPTLAHVIAFVKEMRPELVKETEVRRSSAQADISAPIWRTTDDGRQMADEAVGGPPPAVVLSPAVTGLSSDPITDRVLEIVAEKTGYPKDMLEVDLDLEADLGVDTVKQAETFLALREAFDIPRQENLKLREYPTLAHVIAFVREMRPDLGKETTDDGRQTAEEAASGQPLIAGGPSSIVDRPSSFASRPSSTAAADQLPRRVPVPVLRQSVDLSKPSGVRLDEESRVVVSLDRGGVGKALVGRLEKRGVDVLILNDDPQESIEDQLKGWVEKGPVQGVYWLPALDVEPCLEEMTPEEWNELNRQRVKNLYTVMRFVYGTVAGQGSFLVAATRLGGVHGYSLIDGGAGPDVPAPLGGAVTGFVKAYKREQSLALVKAVDFEASRKTAELAEALIDETLLDPGCVEVGYWQGERYSITLVEQSVEDGGSGLDLDKESVYLVTGAAGGITSAIIADLASASGGTFYLLDLVSPPDAQDPHMQLFRKDKEALKANLIETGKAAGERLTPAKVEKQILSIERQEAALRAVQAVEAAGGKANYYSVDLLDGAAVAKIVDEIRQRHGEIDALIHAAGVEISRALPDKDPQQFDLVFDVKAGGFFNLMHAAKGLPIRACVVFSSVAGRFGNAGQTDYSAANDLLCKLTSSLHTWRPETRGIALDWTAWAGIGMATRGSIPKVMAMAGIEMLPPEVGIPTVRRELTRGSRSGEVVVAGKLGMMFEELDPDGGLDADKASQWLSKQKPRPLMVGEIKSSKLHSGFEVETVLDPREQPFLYDHAMDGTPLLPGVMGTEAFAELACTLAPGWSVAAVENISFLRAFKFFNMEPQRLHMTATICPAAPGELLARAELKSRRALAGRGGEVQEKIHFTASIRLRRESAQQPVVDINFPTEDWTEITKKPIYNIYFHGPAYQVLESVSLNNGQAWGVFASGLPDDTQPAGTAGRMSPRLIELCLQTAGVWELKKRSVLALPSAIRSVEVFLQPKDGSPMPLFALVTTRDGGASFDAQVVDENGMVYVSLTGYSTVPLPVPMEIGD
jgi:NAD(P)-dependent dehydrogenase (short-subunit alcohol dehydrogenase family)/acyl carrier protein